MLGFNSAASSRSVPLKRIAGFCFIAALWTTCAFATEGPLIDNGADKSEIGGIEYTPSLIMGYGVLWGRENPTNIDTELDLSFPQRGAIFETNVPKDVVHVEG